MTCPPKNEHPIDQLLRVVLGLAILSLYFVGPQTDWALLGLVPLMTGLSGRCPLYMVLGWNTRAIGAGEKPRMLKM